MMCSYNALSVTDGAGPPPPGVPACADRALLTGVAREAWNWTGVWVSDCGVLRVISDCHFALQLNSFVPGFPSYSVAVFLK